MNSKGKKQSSKNLMETNREAYPLKPKSTEQGEKLKSLILSKLNSPIHNQGLQKQVLFVKDVLSLYWKWKENVRGSPDSAYSQYIVYSVAQLCFWWWIRDTSIVVAILREIYECEHHFSGLFQHTYIHPLNEQNLWNWGTPGGNSSINLDENQAVFYFLHHATQARLTFNNIRFVDLDLRHPWSVPPVILAIVFLKPSLLLMLLRYGALVLPKTSRKVTEIDGVESSWDLPMLLHFLVQNLWSYLGPDVEKRRASIIVSRSLSDVIQCLRILLRAIPQIPPGSLDFPLITFEESGLPFQVLNSPHFIKHLEEKGLIPYLLRRYHSPAELQHLCRCRIRKILIDKWQLPEGIARLPLSPVHRHYLDLFED